MSDNYFSSSLSGNGTDQARRQSFEGITAGTFVSSLGGGAAAFAIQAAIFLILQLYLPRIYQPRTYLVPEKERTEAPPRGILAWLKPVFKTPNTEFILKCGLDAYLFIRFLRMLLKIFVPLAFLILPILLPINAVGGRGVEEEVTTGPNQHAAFNVTGLDTLGWGNVRSENHNRYWAHLILAVVVIAYVCYVVYGELKYYTELRQAYLTSPEHRLRASATTVLVTNIPKEWLSVEALDGLYDVFPGGIRNIWLNRDCDKLTDKVQLRNNLARRLENAETNLIRNAKSKQVQNAAKQAKLDKEKPMGEDKKAHNTQIDGAADDLANGDGVSAGNPHQLSELTELLGGDSESESPVEASVEESPSRKMTRTATADNDGTNEITYPRAFKPDTADDAGEGIPVWRTYLKDSDRDTMRLPLFGLSWLPFMPSWLGLGQKVDTIYYCRKELARLNLEIEDDQANPERFPLMRSAFIQFNHQVAAHMACQSLNHHGPLQMTPRMVEISPNDVNWDNLSMSWWNRDIRTFVMLLIFCGMIVLWAVPVAFTGSLSRLNELAVSVSWLRWVQSWPKQAVSVIQGILPPVLLALLLFLVPLILAALARFQGCATGSAVQIMVQRYFFPFLFIQVFLVVTISSGLITIIGDLLDNVQNSAQLLAENLPAAANYFFSYMILQALSQSAGALVQIVGLLGWFVWGPMFDSTPRNKWARQVNLPNIHWGRFFPFYTNLAVIGLIYSVVAPLIMVFNVITFSLFWVAYRHNTLFVNRFKNDTGGLLFPTAINQLFTGLYFMELSLVGLFFLVKDHGNFVCQPQAIIMIVTIVITAAYQILLNRTFSPLFRYLPITLEDDAVIRDEEYAKMRSSRWKVDNDTASKDGTEQGVDQYELDNLHDQSPRAPAGVGSSEPERVDTDGANLTAPRPEFAMERKPTEDSTTSPRRGSWAHNASPMRTREFGRVPSDSKIPKLSHKPHRHQHKRSHMPQLSGSSDMEALNDIEAQQRKSKAEINELLYGDIPDGIEDLTAEERDALVDRAFRHKALRARRPVIWIPRDDLGVSDDEVRRTAHLTKFIWISNAGTSLDSKRRCLYKRSPPDFSEIDLIQL